MLAFTLARQDFRENDQIISLYTKEAGRIETVARGVKKIVSKNAPALEPFSLLDAEIVSGKNYLYITKVFAAENYQEIRKEKTKLIIANFVLSFLKKILKVGEPDPRIFKLLHSFFKFLNSSKEVRIIISAAFIGRMICFLGFTPVLGHCSICGKNKFKLIYFIASAGGVVCDVCLKKEDLNGVVISPKLLKKFREIFVAPWKELNDLPFSESDVEQILGCVNNFLVYHFNIQSNFPIRLFSK